MSYNKMLMDNNIKMKSANYEDKVTTNICKVDNVDRSKLRADVVTVESSKKIKDAIICSPLRKAGRGFVTLPEEGALCIVVTAKDGNSFIIGFLSYADSDNIEEHIEPGDISIQPSEDSFIKMSESGGVEISSRGGFESKSEEGTHNYSANIKDHSIARSILTRSIGGYVSSIEKYFSRDIESELSTKEIVDKIMKGEGSFIDERQPILEISKGGVVDDAGEAVKLEIYEADEENPEACYELKIGKGEKPFRYMVGNDGSVYAKFNKIKIVAEEFDLTSVKKIKPDPTEYDWAKEDPFR